MIPCICLHGRITKKQCTELINALKDLPSDAPRALLATGRLVDGGFGYAPLDAPVLAMPIFWKATSRQYAGRLHREHATKNAIRIHDYIDTGYPVLTSMREKWQQGYRAIEYKISNAEAPVTRVRLFSLVTLNDYCYV